MRLPCSHQLNRFQLEFQRVPRPFQVAHFHSPRCNLRSQQGIRFLGQDQTAD